MKVALVSHPRKVAEKPDFPPIGIAYLGGTLNKAGHDVRLLDGGLMGVDAILKRLIEFQPDFIGVTCWTINRSLVWDICQKIKQALPQAFLALGGPHPTYCTEDVFNRTHASAVAIGESEETIIELLEAVEGKRELSTVAGLAIRGKDKNFIITPSRVRIKELDEIPFPWYEGFEGFDFDNYIGLPNIANPTAPVISSRGCVYDCTFCGTTEFWGRKWTCRSAESVLEELEHLINDLGARSIYFFDDNMPVKKDRLKAICDGILQKKWNIEWSCCSHVKMLNLELLQLMKKSGCRRIDFGVESGSDLILNNIDKKQTTKDISETFANCHIAGIEPRSYLMVGNQGETEKTIDETIKLISKIKPHSSVAASLLWLLPGTKDYQRALESGYINRNYWAENDDDIPYNLQEHTLPELEKLRDRLMWGITKNRGGINSIIGYILKKVYYRYRFFGLFRHLVPQCFK